MFFNLSRTACNKQRMCCFNTLFTTAIFPHSLTKAISHFAHAQNSKFPIWPIIIFPFKASLQGWHFLMRSPVCREKFMFSIVCFLLGRRSTDPFVLRHCVSALLMANEHWGSHCHVMSIDINCFLLLFSKVNLICMLCHCSKSLVGMQSGALFGGFLQAYNLGPVHMEASQPAYRAGALCRDLTSSLIPIQNLISVH